MVTKSRKKITRRGMIKLGILSSVLLAAAGPINALKRAYALVPARDLPDVFRKAALEMTSIRDKKLKAVPSTCMQCIAACSIIGYSEDGKLIKIEGNPYGPNNRGMICAKGQAGVNQVYDPDRVLYPLKRVGARGEGKWKRISWNDAIREIASRMNEVYKSGHPEDFMFHYGRSRIKYATGQMMHALSSKTQGNHTSICETGKWVGEEISMGKHYDINDVENSRFILNMGANVFEAHTGHSYFSQRLMDGKMKGAKLVTVDVRLSNTAAKSDEWIPIKPGTDSAVILAMANVIMQEGLYDEKFISKWTNVTVRELKGHLRPYTPEWAEKESSVPAERIRSLAIEFATLRPSTLITYRGFVGHYNGCHSEFAAKMLDAICGNMMVKGGTQMKVSGKWQDPYGKIAKKADKELKERKPKAKKLYVSDADDYGVAIPTHHANHRVFENIKKGCKKTGRRPKIYMTYVYNSVYVNGDCRENIECLKDEKLIPLFIASDTSMSESASLADYILPDATYLERWTAEAPPAFSLTKFLQIRQPVIKPLGEAMDFQDVIIKLCRAANRDTAKYFPFKTGEEYTKKAAELTEHYAAEHGKKLYDVYGKPLKTSLFNYITKYGIVQQSTKPSYKVHENKLKEKDLKNTIVDKETGVIWIPKKTKAKEGQGYTEAKNGYKGYIGQIADGVAYKGFKPDKLNKSGKMELRSRFLKKAERKLLAQLTPILKGTHNEFVLGHIRSGMPTYLPVPEHKLMKGQELIMTSFKVNVQIHSRSQNCKWLSEIYHKNPAWINSKTAEKLGIKDGDMVRVKVVEKKYPEIGYSLPQARELTTRANVTEGIHPSVIAISFHCGHWAYGRVASGKAAFPENKDNSNLWWQKGTRRKFGPVWDEAKGVHPNWIIPNAPDPVSGQWRSNDTVVMVEKA
ncbi:MAG: molybdopterin-dependent oxidoreductase [Omnitrophica bacterium]|nr:molybdopterin-dependent oxidoreductase [Candidatus Omnitrophota bacterium]